MIQKIEIKVKRQILTDLKSRLKRSKWPDTILNSNWSFGADLQYMKELTEYWINKYDWRNTEDEINRYDNFIAEIDGYKIHFLHIKGKEKSNMPLIITHGWPGSFLEIMKLIPLLTESAEQSFDLIIPSMMGFGFSDKITSRGCNVAFMADLWFKLMQQLGYNKFGVQGGDFGAGVASFLTLKYPKHVIGMHLNYIPGNYKPVLNTGESLSEEEIAFLGGEEEWYTREGGYDLQQRTKPLTLAYSLTDSPVGLCAWIVEKMQGWADCKGNIESVFTKEELLANVTLYWVTGTIHSSMRLYAENKEMPLRLGDSICINVPVGIARFRFEEPFPPRCYIERGFTNIQHWSDFPEGGHFAAMEKPETLANDIRDFFIKIK